ncbi:hypothetical protein MKW94_028930, partial [Papaver nudicaule]|nr:hypothetical protein [Papaver nudicaule]
MNFDDYVVYLKRGGRLLLLLLFHVTQSNPSLNRDKCLSLSLDNGYVYPYCDE